MSNPQIGQPGAVTHVAADGTVTYLPEPTLAPSRYRRVVAGDESGHRPYVNSYGSAGERHTKGGAVTETGAPDNG